MPTPTCINLRERFGRRYRVEYEPSYYAERGAGARADDPWPMVIPCENGHICPWGGSTLTACTKAAGSVANRLKALPFTTVAQDGSDGANVLFDVNHFDVVATIMKPRRRRRLSPEARRAAGERLAKYQFRHAVQAPDLARPCEFGGPGDSEHLSQQLGPVDGSTPL